MDGERNNTISVYVMLPLILAGVATAVARAATKAVGVIKAGPLIEIAAAAAAAKAATSRATVAAATSKAWTTPTRKLWRCLCGWMTYVIMQLVCT